MKQISQEDIKTLFHISTKKKTSNLLEGDFRSIFRGRSMDFDDLREYTYGDDVHDIDWKASSRSGVTLVRRNTAERKHFLLFVGDSGEKMNAHTSKGQLKSEIAVETMGALANIANGLGIDYALLHSDHTGFNLTSFHSSSSHLNQLLNSYSSHIELTTKNTPKDLLNHALEHIQKRMLVVVISDLSGLDTLDSKLIKDVEEKNDLFIVNIDDAYLSDSNTYDISRQQYAIQHILKNETLLKEEKIIRSEKEKELLHRFQSNAVQYTAISHEEEIVDKIIALFEGNA